MIKRLLAIFMAAALVISAAGCGQTPADGSSTISSSSKPSSSYDDYYDDYSSSDIDSSDSSDTHSNNQNLGGVKGEVSSDESSSVYLGDSGEYSLWGNPIRYVIIHAKGNTTCKNYATQIQQYFYETYGFNLPIKDDSTAAGEFEILVGKTNRAESNKNIKEGDYQVSVKNNKLVFDAGHDVVLEMAINHFLRERPKNDADASTKGSTDFKATALGKYNYVWGDEFDTEDVDFTKWTFIAKMGGTKTAEIATDKDVIEVENGKLILRSMEHPTSLSKKFKMPTSVVSQHNMMYTYGYCEIKAKMPFFRGAWPSFWTQSSTGIGERKCFDYFVEVDIFEVFGTADEVVSNIHKWYKDGTHSQWNKKKDTWFAPNPDTINDEYHIYGYEWTKTDMSFYVDGEKIMTYDITTSYDKVEDMSGFHDPQYIIFNNHLFTEDANWKPNTITGNESMLPSVYSIEYFRLYQKKGEGRLWTDTKVYKTFER